MTKGKQIAVGSEQKQLSLTVGLVRRTMHIALGQLVEFWFQLRVETVDIVHVNVIGKAAGAGRRCVFASLLPDAESCGLALHVGIVGETQLHFKVEEVDEKLQSFLQIFNDHEGRYLDEVGREFGGCVCQRHAPLAVG